MTTPSNTPELKNKSENLQSFSENQLALINEKASAFFRCNAEGASGQVAYWFLGAAHSSYYLLYSI